MKAVDVHKMSSDELSSEVERLRRHLFDLKAQAATEKIENPRQFRNARRDIARLLTESRQRQLKAES